MKDAKGHGSDSRGAAHQEGIVRAIPTYANADAIVSRLRADSMERAGKLSDVTQAPGWIERFGKARRAGRNPV